MAMASAFVRLIRLEDCKRRRAVCRAVSAVRGLSGFRRSTRTSFLDIAKTWSISAALFIPRHFLSIFII